jgi:hypothetical protein
VCSLVAATVNAERRQAGEPIAGPALAVAVHVERGNCPVESSVVAHYLRPKTWALPVQELQITLKGHFRGKTELHIEVEYLKWQLKNAGKERVIKKNPTVHLPMNMEMIDHQELEAPDAYAASIEYQILPPRRTSPKIK